MSELSYLAKLLKATDIAKQAHVGMMLTYFDVIELRGEINSLREYIADLEAEVLSLETSRVLYHEELMDLRPRIAELEAENLELRKTLGWAYDLDEYKDEPEVQE